MVVVMEYFGFGIMFLMMYELLFLFVWWMLMFDYFMKGCVGWNIVMLYLLNVVCNFGFDGEIDYDICYEIVEEYFDVFYKFWEGLWDDDVIVEDCE